MCMCIDASVKAIQIQQEYVRRMITRDSPSSYILSPSPALAPNHLIFHAHHLGGGVVSHSNAATTGHQT